MLCYCIVLYCIVLYCIVLYCIYIYVFKLDILCVRNKHNIYKHQIIQLSIRVLFTLFLVIFVAESTVTCIVDNADTIVSNVVTIDSAMKCNVTDTKIV